MNLLSRIIAASNAAKASEKNADGDRTASVENVTYTQHQHKSGQTIWVNGEGHYFPSGWTPRMLRRVFNITE